MPGDKGDIVELLRLCVRCPQFEDAMAREILNPHFWARLIRSYQLNFSLDCVNLRLLLIPVPSVDSYLLIRSTE